MQNAIFGCKQIPFALDFRIADKISTGASLEECRQELTASPWLSALREAVDDLPQFWQSLVDYDQTLCQVPGGKYLFDFTQWIKNGGSFPHFQSTAPNHYALAVTVLLQITQYTRHLDILGKSSHRKILDAVNAGGGIQGLCIGFLSAAAVASSESESDLGAAAATALR